MGFFTAREGTVYAGDQARKPIPKPIPRVLAKEEKKKSKETQEKDAREFVWKRDESKCRATGVPLVRSGTIDDTRLGEVDHTLLRSTHPDKVYDTSNMLLIQKRLNRLRKESCRNAPQFKYFDYDGPADRAKPQTFIWRDHDGNITRKEIG